MFEESKKSIESILSQRLSSPFYGTLIISWLIWNWKIIYLTIFISADDIEGTKIDYIVNNYNDGWILYGWPLISTAVLLLIVPFLTYWAYWLELIFNKKRLDKKNLVEGKQLLSIEQSINLREQIVNMENRFTTLLSDKDSEIAQLKAVINERSSRITAVDDNDDEEGYFDNEINDIVKKINENDDLFTGYRNINKHVIYKTDTLLDSVSPEILSYYIANDLIANTEYNNYKWTDKGKEVQRSLVNDNFNI